MHGSPLLWNLRAKSWVGLALGVFWAGLLQPAAHAQELAKSGGPDLQLTISGPKETVFAWKTQRCTENDIPDISLRAFRRADGQIIGFGSHFTTRRFFIERDGLFRRDCKIVLESVHDPDPSRFNDKVWISSVWTADGQTVVALGHNEFQGNQHPGACAFRQYLQCWYNSIVLLRSLDGGESFARVPGTAPVANVGYRHDALQGQPRGFFEPTNFVEHEGHWYTLIYTSGGADHPLGTCLFRTARVDADSAWEHWGGSGFAPSRYDPYAGHGGAPPACKVLENLNGRVSAIVRHRPTGLYLALLYAQDPALPSGWIGYSVSSDLIHWSPVKFVIWLPLIWSKNCRDTSRYAAAGLLDLQSQDRNFQDIGERAHVYMIETRIQGCRGSMERNLVRYPIQIR